MNIIPFPSDHARNGMQTREERALEELIDAISNAKLRTGSRTVPLEREKARTAILEATAQMKAEGKL